MESESQKSSDLFIVIFPVKLAQLGFDIGSLEGIKHVFFPYS